MSKKWSAEKHNYLIELRQSGDYTWQGIADAMTDKFSHVYTAEQCRGRWRNNRHKIDEIDPVKKYGKRVRTHKDGSKTIEQLIEEYAGNELNTPKDILIANNLDPSEWDLKDHDLSVWGHHTKVDGTVTLYASKIKVKQKEIIFDWEKLTEAIENGHSDPRIKAEKEIRKGQYLNIPVFDLHFGHATRDYDRDALKEALAIIEQGYDEIGIIIGQDQFHNDNFLGKAA